MNTISCIVVDDEPLAVSLLESYVKKTPFLELRGGFTSGKAAYSYLMDNTVDLVFLDIQMPGLSGMNLSKMLPERCKVIFTTAFSDYAIEGFRVHALDYLLKPVSYEDFLSAVTHARSVIETLSRKETATPEANYIFVKSEYRLRRIELSRITFIEGLKDYVKIRLDDGSDPVLSLMRMKDMEEQLPASQFIRVHRSYIVNIAKIDAIERNRIIIGEERLPIGESYLESLLSRLSGNAH